MNEKVQILKRNMEQRIVGKGDVIDKVILTLLSGGHLLLEDVPGVGKTSLAKALADSLSLSFSRIQCTPDTTPSDITGLSVYNSAEGVHAGYDAFRHHRTIRLQLRRREIPGRPRPGHEQHRAGR